MSITIRVAGRQAKVKTEEVDDDSVSGGIGGWEQLPRPRRTAALAWVGTPGLTWVLPVLLDGFDTGRSVESDCERLTSWGLPGNDDTPPILVVDAPAGRAPADSRWVLDSIEWGEQARNAAGDRIQQYATLTFLEYIPGQVLKGPAAKSRGKRGKDKNRDKGDRSKGGMGSKGKGGK